MRESNRCVARQPVANREVNRHINPKSPIARYGLLLNRLQGNFLLSSLRKLLIKTKLVITFESLQLDRHVQLDPYFLIFLKLALNVYEQSKSIQKKKTTRIFGGPTYKNTCFNNIRLNFEYSEVSMTKNDGTVIIFIVRKYGRDLSVIHCNMLY